MKNGPCASYPGWISYFGEKEEEEEEFFPIPSYVISSLGDVGKWGKRGAWLSQTKRKAKSTTCRGEEMETLTIGEFHDQGDAKWIVLRRSLWGHNDPPFGRPKPGRPIGRPGVGHPYLVFWCF
jgi:hypothetical protein